MKLDLKAEHTPYFNKAGKRVAGVTTILGVLAKPALLGWYASEERKGVVEYLRAGRPLPVKKDGKPLWFAEAKRDKAADIGTVTHFRVQCWLSSETAETDGIAPDIWSQSQHGFDRFRTWWDGEGFTLIESEKVMVHEDPFGMTYGGTADILCRDSEGRKVLVDLKTSKASPYWPYNETFGQVAAYAKAEERIVAEAVDRIIVDRIGKELGDELQVFELSGEQRGYGHKLFCAAYDAFHAIRRLDDLR